MPFDQFPKFSKRYHLTGELEHGVRDLFHPDLIKSFERYYGFAAEGVGQQLLIYWAGQRLEPNRFHEVIELGVYFYSLFVPEEKYVV